MARFKTVWDPDGPLREDNAEAARMITGEVERTIEWGDLDALGIVYYPRYYGWMDAAAGAFLGRAGLETGALWRERHILFGLVKTACRYSRPGRLHDRIRITTRIDALKSMLLVLQHTVTRMADGRLLARGVETRACMDVSDPLNIRARVIPKDIHAILKQAQDRSS